MSRDIRGAGTSAEPHPGEAPKWPAFRALKARNLSSRYPRARLRYLGVGLPHLSNRHIFNRLHRSCRVLTFFHEN